MRNAVGRFDWARWMASMVLVLAMSLGVTACGGDDDDDDDSASMDDDTSDDDTGDDDSIDDDAGDDDSGDDDADESFIRVIHLAPMTPAVDVYVNSEILAFSDIAFEEGTPYAALPPATYDFQITLTGETDPALEINDFAMAADTYYTAAAINEAVEILPLVDDYSDLAEGNIRVRAIHAAAAVGEVDIWLIPDGDDPTPLWENVPFKGVGEYLDVPAVALTIGFDVDDDATPDVIFDIPALTAGTVANVFAVSDDEDNVFLAAQLGDEAGTVVRIDPTI